jgi:N-ethylmaleimide reductase
MPGVLLANLLVPRTVTFSIQIACSDVQASGRRACGTTAARLSVAIMLSPPFSAFSLASLPLKNRIVMAPMTRCRAIGNVPNQLMATYYRLRSDAGLILTEGTAPSPNGLGYARIPGCYSQEQVVGWRGVTSAVHEAGGHIFLQLMHTGRISHPANMPAGARIVAPSAIAAPGSMYTDAQGPQPHPVPEAMTEADIEQAVQEFATSAALAIEAGFDGVEIHAANGYLVEQFLNLASNQRTDGWGQTVAGRARFALAVTRAVVGKIGKSKVGIRLSPYGANGGMTADAETDALYTHLATELSALGIAYIHIVDHSPMGAPPVKAELKATLRQVFKGAYILSGGYDRARAEADLAENKGDLVAFGRPFLQNPTLVEQLEAGSAILPPDVASFFTPGEQGYLTFSATAPA